MAAESSSLTIFKDGTTQLLASLTDDIDDETATTTIRYALQAVGTNAEKLTTLFVTIYDMPTPRGECPAKLFVKLLENAADSISAVFVRHHGEVSKRGLKLFRHYALNLCQDYFERAMTCTIWPAKPIVITVALYQAGFLSDTIIGHMLEVMTESEHLFLPQNFQEFANT